MLASAFHQHESVISTYVSPPLDAPSSRPHPITLDVTEHHGELPVLYGNSPLATSLKAVISMIQCHSLNLTRSLLPPLCPKSVFYVCISIPALQVGSSVPFYIYVLIHNICFSLSDLFSLCITGSRFIHFTRAD